MTKTKKRAGLAAVCIAAVLVLGVAGYFAYGNTKLVNIFSEKSLSAHLASADDPVTVLAHSGAFKNCRALLFQCDTPGGDPGAVYFAMLEKSPYYADRYRVISANEVREPIAFDQHESPDGHMVYFLYGNPDTPATYSVFAAAGDALTQKLDEITVQDEPFVTLAGYETDAPLFFAEGSVSLEAANALYKQ